MKVKLSGGQGSMLMSWSSICYREGTYQSCLLTRVQIDRSCHYFSQSHLSRLHVRWLAIMKMGQCVWSEVHHRPTRWHRGLRTILHVLWRWRESQQNGKCYWAVFPSASPEPGGVSMHFVTPSWPSHLFPCSSTGSDGTFMLGIPWPQGHLLLLLWEPQARRQK